MANEPGSGSKAGLMQGPPQPQLIKLDTGLTPENQPAGSAPSDLTAMLDQELRRADPDGDSL